MAKIYSQLPGKSQFSCSPGAGAHGSGPVPFKAWRLMKPSLSPTVNIQPALSEQVCNITCWQQEIFFNLLNTHTHARLPHTGSHARTKVLKKGIFPGNRWKTINKMVGKAFWFSLLREAIDRGHMWGDFILSFRKQATSSSNCTACGQGLWGSSGTSGGWNQQGHDGGQETTEMIQLKSPFYSAQVPAGWGFLMGHREELPIPYR